jgi:hypothetical protein
MVSNDQEEGPDAHTCGPLPHLHLKLSPVPGSMLGFLSLY